MLLRNHTPYVPLVFKSQDEDGDDFHVVVMRGSFGLGESGSLELLGDQEPLVLADDYRGVPGQSSVRIESDVVPHKPFTDIILDAVAQAPAGRPIPSWLVRVKVGRIQKELRVTGPRVWRRKPLGRWGLSDPEPCTQVPLHYELAYGGTANRGSKNEGAEETSVFKANPVGRGHVEKKWLGKQDEVPAPQIESPGDPIRSLGKPCRVEGLGPIPKAWEPRCDLGGTADEDWVANRWPMLPEDFDWRFYNGAHPDLVYPGYLLGDEEVVLEGLHLDGPRSFQLPGEALSAVARDVDGFESLIALNLDTLFIDTTHDRVYLTWRGSLLDQGGLEVVEPHAHPLSELVHG